MILASEQQLKDFVIRLAMIGETTSGNVHIFSEPGMGKVNIVKNALSTTGKRIVSINIFPDRKEVLELINSVEDGDVLLIEEIMAIPKPALELLCTKLTNFDRNYPIIILSNEKVDKVLPMPIVVRVTPVKYEIQKVV